MFTSLLIGWCTSGIAKFLNIFLTVNCPVQIVLRNQTINWLSWWEKCNVGFLTGTCCCIYLNRAPNTFYMYLDSVQLMFSTLDETLQVEATEALQMKIFFKLWLPWEKTGHALSAKKTCSILLQRFELCSKFDSVKVISISLQKWYRKLRKLNF